MKYIRRVSQLFLWASVTCLATEGTAIARGSDPEPGIYAVLETDPPGVLLLDTGSLKPLGTVTIEQKPAFATLVPGRVLYLFQNAGACPISRMTRDYTEWKGPSSITVIDLNNQKVIKAIPLGWNVLRVLPSDDGGRLITFGVGRPGRKDPKPEEEACVHVIDTRTHQIVNRFAMGPFAQELHATPDLKRLIVLRAREMGGLYIWSKRALTFPGDVAACLAKSEKYPKAGTYELAVLDPDQTKSVGEISLPGNPTALTLSPDSQWAYALDAGWPDRNPKNYRGGLLHVVDLATGMLSATHAVGTLPIQVEVDEKSGVLTVLSHASATDSSGRLYRLRGKDMLGSVATAAEPLLLERYEGLDQPVIFTKDEICLLDARGETERPYVPFSWVRELSAKEHDGWLDPEPVRTAYAADRRLLLLHSGEKDQKLAIVDLKAPKSSALLPIGRQDVKSARDSGIFALNVLLFAASAGGCNPARGCLAPSPHFLTGLRAWVGGTVAIRPDGKYAYVGNGYTKDVTAVNLESRQVEKFFGLSGAGGGLLLTDGGKHLWTYSNKQVTVIDTVKNEILWQPATPTEIRQLVPPDERGVALALCENELLILDSAQARVSGRAEGLKKAQMFLMVPGTTGE